MNKLDLILLIDDDDIVNFYNEDLLDTMGVADKIVITKDGQDALDYIEKKGEYQDNTDPKPNLILLDINMPRMNGFEFLDAYSALKEKDQGGEIVCMLTTSLHHEDRKKADSYKQISAYLSKPLDEDKVNSILKDLF